MTVLICAVLFWWPCDLTLKPDELLCLVCREDAHRGFPGAVQSSLLRGHGQVLPDGPRSLDRFGNQLLSQRSPTVQRDLTAKYKQCRLIVGSSVFTWLDAPSHILHPPRPPRCFTENFWFYTWFHSEWTSRNIQSFDFSLLNKLLTVI